jgi:hypothetical protein
VSHFREVSGVSFQLAVPPSTASRKLQIDPQTERILDDPEAMSFFKREYRQPWVVADKVQDCRPGATRSARVS